MNKARGSSLRETTPLLIDLISLLNLQSLHTKTLASNQYLIPTVHVVTMSQKRRDSWKNAERHHCACCNAWMGSDRQSILIHENGKKHRENMEASLLKRREGKLLEEKEAKAMADSLKMMEEAAARAHSSDVASGAFSSGLASSSGLPQGHVHSANAQADSEGLGELKSWQDRKEKRKKVKSSGDGVDRDEKPKRMRLELKPDEGHYQRDQNTYLEGGIYASIFEEDMPVQIWTGSSTITSEYRKSDEAQEMWKTGIILRIHKHSNSDEGNASDILCDVSYLKDLNDEDETIEKKVVGDRLRLILGSDELIPATIEEARLSLMGEEIISMDNGTEAQIDENTGLSGWGTVSIRKVTVSQEVKEERARARAKRREELEKEKSKERDAEARRMEEAKHTNADDSALGAYDIWSTSGNVGYKGVKLQTDSKIDASDCAKSLAKGRTDVKFKTTGASKKAMFERAKKKQNRRKTFADDD